jgi:hypothetical protein
MKTLSPSWSDAFSYAFESGYLLPFALAIAVLAIGAFVFIARKNDAEWLGNGFLYEYTGVVLFVIFAIALTLFSVKPLSIKTDNEKTVTEETYKYYESKNDNFKTFWDSVYQNNKMLEAAKK